MKLIADASQDFKTSAHPDVWRAVGLLTTVLVAVAYYIGAAIIFAIPYAAYHWREPVALAYLVVAAVLVLGPAAPAKQIRHSRLYKSVALYFDAKVFAEDEMSLMSHHPKPVLILNFPHGVISFGGWCVGSLYYAREAVTGCADAVVRLPFLRQLLGPFGMVSSSRVPMREALCSGMDVCLYSGGLAELFLCRRDKEQLYFKHRKGCIKLAIESGADVRLCYMFGNSSMFDLLCGPYTAWLSRHLRISMCLFWGRWFLPVPHKTKVIAVLSRTITMPDYSKNRESITPALIQQQHDIVLKELQKLFDEHKHLHPEYEDKQLIFV
ncbi:diacylglycerol acyltransferase [Gregarina niphandrodes]|uniref:Acyltransferase n=1 Tax=Gregarina niphandrodes TaxID=110365 RepID=A0A023BAJ1_GRENI|nr:diacylglycerol acyltransferase [Gregarina niphandrodes]EZG78237.1 diacylglycerol acyltransferase [Gregarina niphandrodes]|eukprot:XP_011129387.1 diacylglycerol acyltransferase [Gregarina niphandrodes]